LERELETADEREFVVGDQCVGRGRRAGCELEFVVENVEAGAHRPGEVQFTPRPYAVTALALTFGLASRDAAGPVKTVSSMSTPATRATSSIAPHVPADGLKFVRGETPR